MLNSPCNLKNIRQGLEIEYQRFHKIYCYPIWGLSPLQGRKNYQAILIIIEKGSVKRKNNVSSQFMWISEIIA